MEELLNVKTYGSLVWDDKTAIIDAVPHVRGRIKNIITGYKQNGNKLRIPLTRSTIQDLEMIFGRWPMDCCDGLDRHIFDEAERIRTEVAEIDQVLAGGGTPKLVDMVLELRSYQAVAVELLRRKGRYLLADPIGLGKTPVAIGGHASALGPTIVVCQNHLCRQWAREFEKFLGPDVRIHLQLSGKEAKLPDHDVVILPYTMLAKWSDRLVGYPYLVLDEVQELRHEGTAKYSGAKVLSLQASHVLALSGTPVINYGDEIYNVLDIVDPGCLGPRPEFVRTWCRMQGANSMVVDPVALGTFLAEDHLLLRRTRQEVKKELPPVSRIIHDVIFNQRMIEQMSKEMLPLARAILAEDSTFNERGQASRQLDLKLRQKTGILKAPFAAEAIADIVMAGEKVLVTAWHRECYSVITNHLAGKEIPYWLYTGTETSAQKDAAAQAFINQDGPCVLLMSIRSGAGLNGLERVCSTVIHVELDWSGKIIDQATGRLARDGQECHITEILLVASGGSDPIVANILGIKEGQSAGIVDPTVDRSLETPTPEEEMSRGTALAKRVLETLNLQTTICT